MLLRRLSHELEHRPLATIAVAIGVTTTRDRKCLRQRYAIVAEAGAVPQLWPTFEA
jgi:hypothetical protein